MKPLNLLLIDDDVGHCEMYTQYVRGLGGTHLLTAVDGIKQGLSIVGKSLPDVIILDLELNNSDGDGIAFLQKLHSLGLKEIPYVIVITNNLSQNTHTLARQCGADYIFIKTKIDYSPKLVIDFATRYIENKTHMHFEVKSSQNDEILKLKADRLVESIGVTSDMTGKKYLVDAIYLVYTLGNDKAQLSKNIYPQLAKQYKKSDFSIEKAISNAIRKAWRITDNNILAANYTAGISVEKGLPTNKELIFYFADKLKIL